MYSPVCDRFQNEARWPQELQLWGCHLFCFLFWIETVIGRSFSTEEVLSIFRSLQKMNVLSWEGFVVYPQRFLDIVAPGRFRWLGRVISLGSKHLGLALWCRETDKGTVKHFTCITPSMWTIYDPMKGGSDTVRFGVLKNIRAIEVISDSV